MYCSVSNSFPFPFRELSSGSLLTYRTCPMSEMSNAQLLCRNELLGVCCLSSKAKDTNRRFFNCGKV